MNAHEEALTLRSGPNGGWTAFADPRYESVNGMFGGWTAAVLLRCAMESPQRRGAPASLTVNFVRKVEPDRDVMLRAEYVGGGRSIQHWRSTMIGADDALLAQAIVTFAERQPTDGYTEPSMPHVERAELREEFHPPGPQGERVSHRALFGYPMASAGNSLSCAWLRELTGRSVDHLQLAFLADNYAPRVFSVNGPRLSLTVALSVYFLATEDELARIGDDYVLAEFAGTRGAASLSGQQVRLWSSTGALIATSEQLQWYR